jgi:hypothetical protein
MMLPRCNSRDQGPQQKHTHPQTHTHQKKPTTEKALDSLKKENEDATYVPENDPRKKTEEKDKKEIENLTEEEFSKYLWTNKVGAPDPDLIIRTSGEMRLSNFLTWQSVYSELFFVKKYWPDFSSEDFKAVLEEFSLRQRRLGK